LFIRGLFVAILMGSSARREFFYSKLGMIIYFFILVRGTLPRFRYDKLMSLAWKLILPGVLLSMIIVSNIILWV
jgi:NADH:ubiquinone oxidoreductase subunit H